jgi:integrase
MPAHIDPRRLPKRCYWDGRDRVWYTIHKGPPARRQNFANAKATLADLHRAIENIAAAGRDTLGYVLDEFNKSAQFKALAPRTREDYEYQRKVADKLKTSIGPVTALKVSKMTTVLMRRLFDVVAENTPTKANQLLRYMRRALNWGIEFGYCAANPCKGLKQAKERKRRRLPDAVTYSKVLAFARARGALPAHTRGSAPPYLWMLMEVGYLCRLRPVETVTLTDADLLERGLETNRRKNSNDSLVLWNDRLRSVIAAAQELRKRQTTGKPVPLRAEDRRLFVSEDGTPLSEEGMSTAWQRLMRAAIDAGVITAEQRFGLHDLKRKGITDTPGTRGEKQLASGHKEEAMLDVYDQSVPAVKPAGE